MRTAVFRSHQLYFSFLAVCRWCPFLMCPIAYAIAINLFTQLCVCSSSLQVVACRVLWQFLVIAFHFLFSIALTSGVATQAKRVLTTVLLPAMTMVPVNAQVPAAIWEILESFPYPARFCMYSDLRVRLVTLLHQSRMAVA